MLVLVLFIVLAMYARPMLSVADSWSDAKTEDRRLEDVKRENRRLQKRHDELTKGSGEPNRAPKTATAPSGTAEPPSESAPGASPDAGGVVGTETGGADPTLIEPDPTVHGDPGPAPGGGAGQGGGGGGGTSTGAVSG